MKNRWEEVLNFSEVFIQMIQAKGEGYVGEYTDVKDKGIYFRVFKMRGPKVWTRLAPIHKASPIRWLAQTRLVEKESRHRIAFAAEAGLKKGMVVDGYGLAYIKKTILEEDAMSFIASRALMGDILSPAPWDSPFEYMQKRLNGEGAPEAMPTPACVAACHTELAKGITRKKNLRILCRSKAERRQLETQMAGFGFQVLAPAEETIAMIRIPVFASEDSSLDEETALPATTAWVWNGSTFKRASSWNG